MKCPSFQAILFFEALRAMPHTLELHHCYRYDVRRALRVLRGLSSNRFCSYWRAAAATVEVDEVSHSLFWAGAEVDPTFSPGPGRIARTEKSSNSWLHSFRHTLKMAESLPSQGTNQTKPTEKEPPLVQLDPKWCANSIIALATKYLTCDKPPFCPQGVLRAIENQRFPC